MASDNDWIDGDLSPAEERALVALRPGCQGVQAEQSTPAIHRGTLYRDHSVLVLRQHPEQVSIDSLLSNGIGQQVTVWLVRGRGGRRRVIIEWQEGEGV